MVKVFLKSMFLGLLTIPVMLAVKYLFELDEKQMQVLELLNGFLIYFMYTSPANHALVRQKQEEAKKQREEKEKNCGTPES